MTYFLCEIIRVAFGLNYKLKLSLFCTLVHAEIFQKSIFVAQF